jgi:hypothetical protein
VRGAARVREERGPPIYRMRNQRPTTQTLI